MSVYYKIEARRRSLTVLDQPKWPLSHITAILGDPVGFTKLTLYSLLLYLLQGVHGVLTELNYYFVLLKFARFQLQ